MYTLVLCMALGNAPATNPDYLVPDAHARPSSQLLYRGKGCNGCSGGSGCSGSGYGCSGYGVGCSGGGWACHGGGVGCSGGGRTMMYGPADAPAGEPARRMPEPLPPPMTRQTEAAPATLIVNLPANSVLTIDDTPTTAVAARRTFVSPPLTPGVEYHYNLKMELQRNGETVAVTKRVAVRAGEQTEVTLDAPPASVASR